MDIQISIEVQAREDRDFKVLVFGRGENFKDAIEKFLPAYTKALLQGRTPISKPEITVHSPIPVNLAQAKTMKELVGI